MRALCTVFGLFSFAFVAGGLFGAAQQPTDPYRPAAITTTNVPVIPPELVERLNQYQNVRTAKFRGWAFDGRGILIQTRFGETEQLHRVYQPGGRREQVTFFDEPVTGRFLPADSKGSLLVQMGTGGNEQFQISLIDGKTAHRTLLTDGKSRNVLGAVMHDGSKIAFASNSTDPRNMDLWVVDPHHPDAREMVMKANGAYWIPEDWSPDGKKLLINRYVSATESYPAWLDLTTKKRVVLPILGVKTASFDHLRYSGDGNKVYLTTDAASEFHQLARIGMTTFEFTRLTKEIPWDVEHLEVHKPTGRAAFAVNEDGASALFVLEEDKRKRLTIPVGIVEDLEFSPDGAQLGFTLSRPSAPGDAFSLALADGKVTQWSFSEAGGLDGSTFVAPTLTQYESFDRRKIPAYVFTPPGASPEKPAPVLIKIHGGPEGQYRPYFNSIDQFYVLELGMAVIQPNVRGSSGYGKTYVALDNALLREDSVKDIGALLDWIATQPQLDKSRVFVMGGSYGGYMTLASLVHYSDRLRGGVDIVGIASFNTFLKNTSEYRQDLRRAEYGDERTPEMRAFFDKIDPANNAHKIRAALFLAHGRNDPRVPFSEAEQIARRVSDLGRPVWTVYASNEGHGFLRKQNRDYTTAAIVLFLKQQLK